MLLFYEILFLLNVVQPLNWFYLFVYHFILSCQALCNCCFEKCNINKVYYHLYLQQRLQPGRLPVSEVEETVAGMMGV